jgi:hypothetical protein
LLQPLFYRFNSLSEVVKLSEFGVLVENVSGRQALQSTVRPVQKAHERLYGLDNALREQGKPLSNQFIPLLFQFGLELRSSSLGRRCISWLSSPCGRPSAARASLVSDGVLSGILDVMAAQREKAGG